MVQLLSIYLKKLLSKLIGFRTGLVNLVRRGSLTWRNVDCWKVDWKNVERCWSVVCATGACKPVLSVSVIFLLFALYFTHVSHAVFFGLRSSLFRWSSHSSLRFALVTLFVWFAPQELFLVVIVFCICARTSLFLMLTDQTKTV